jgi:Cdc6-like AAA superfamily ATPase
VALNSYVDDYSSEFLTLFSKKELNLGLIGVSNTIDALEKYNAKVFFSLYEIRNLVFSPYDLDTISMIIENKLNEIKERFDFRFEITSKLLKFASRKL